MEVFERDLLPTLRRFARYYCGHDQDLEADALSYGWYRWRALGGKCVSAARLARLVCKSVLAGKATIPVPGPKPQPYEAWTRKRRPLNPPGHADRAPSVLRTVIARDLLSVLQQRVRGRRLRVLDCYARGEYHLGRIAAALGVTLRTVNDDVAQLRRVLRHLLRP